MGKVLLRWLGSLFPFSSCRTNQTLASSSQCRKSDRLLKFPLLRSQQYYPLEGRNYSYHPRYTCWEEPCFHCTFHLYMWWGSHTSEDTLGHWNSWTWLYELRKPSWNSPDRSGMCASYQLFLCSCSVAGFCAESFAQTWAAQISISSRAWESKIERRPTS